MENFKKEKVSFWRRIAALALAAALALGLAACDASAVVPGSSTPTVSTAQPAGDGQTANFEMHFLDVGQALSVLVECDGQYMLYDGGNVDDGSYVVSYLQNLGVEELQYVFCSHAHEDHVGGLSGAFIPVSEDDGMIKAAECGSLTLEKLEAMTAVCSVGIDMVVIPGDTTAEVISGLIADEAAIGMVNSKTTAVRIIPAPGKQVGDTVAFGGLLGSAPVMPVNRCSAAEFIARGGRIPAPLHSLKN